MPTPSDSLAVYAGFEDPLPDGATTAYRSIHGLFQYLIGAGFKGLNDEIALLILCWIAPTRGGQEARRHVLLEGAAGTAKTHLTKVFAQALFDWTAQGKGLQWGELKHLKSYKRRASDYQRVQGTPDILPSSFLGYESRTDTGRFAFNPGPMLQPCCVFHVDEINRIPSRTLSVLLEGMAEASVTVSSLVLEADKPKLDLPELFVVATQNPGSFIGTGALPEPLLDRFMARVIMPFPEREQLKSIVEASDFSRVREKLGVSPVKVAVIRELTAGVDITTISSAIVEITLASWPRRAAAEIRRLPELLTAHRGVREFVDKNFKNGLGVRAAQALRDLSAAVAWCRHRGGPAAADDKDLERVASYAIAHRLAFQKGVADAGMAQIELTEEFLKHVSNL